jgi:O-antigen/teichoic acid export membrane protein
MSGVAKKLVGQTAAYGVSSIIGRVLNFLLFPLYLGIFAREDYGIINGLYAYVAFFNILYIFGLETAFFRFANQPGVDRQQLFNKVLSFLVVTSTLLSGAIIILVDPIATLLDLPGQQLFIQWLALILAIDAIVAIPFARLRLENKARKFAAIKMANILITVFANVFIYWFYQGDFLPALRPWVALVYFPEWKLGYIFLINLVANFLLIPMLWREFASWRFQLDLAFLRPLLRYGYPIMFMGFAGMVNEVLDRILLLRVLPDDFYPDTTPLEALGVYGANYKLAVLMSLAIQAFRYAGEPFFFSQAREKNSPQTFAQVMKWFVIVCAFIFLFISVNLEDFRLLLRKEQFYAGLPVVPVLLMANIFLGIYYNLSIWFKLADKTKYGTFIGFGGAAVTIVLNLLLIPHFGYLGCAWATLACYLSMALACYYFGQKHYPIPYPVGAIFFYLAAALALYLAGAHIRVADVIWRHVFHLGLCAAFLLLVLAVERPRLKIKA